jgi:hypothetical protein
VFIEKLASSWHTPEDAEQLVPGYRVCRDVSKRELRLALSGK